MTGYVVDTQADGGKGKKIEKEKGEEDDKPRKPRPLNQVKGASVYWKLMPY